MTAYDNYQLNIEDAIEVAEHDVVWFVDASRTGAAPFTVNEITPAATLEFTSHLVRPEAILAMARQYYGGAPHAFLLGVRGYEFEFVEALTPRRATISRWRSSMLDGTSSRAPYLGAGMNIGLGELAGPSC